MFFYSDTEKGAPFDPRRMRPYHEQDATRYALTHFDNVLFLQAVIAAPKSFAEKAQAEKELRIGERKIEHWRKHPNFDQQKFSDEAQKRKAMWDGR